MFPLPAVLSVLLSASFPLMRTIIAQMTILMLRFVYKLTKIDYICYLSNLIYVA